jgi:HSP20 family molecular chaperone IbpA
MRDNDFNDIFDLMDRIFGMGTGGDTNLSSSSGKNKYERLIDGDHIYYTFELRSVKKDAINVSSKRNQLTISFYDEEMDSQDIIELPYAIKPDETKVTFINGILDITVTIDKEESNIVEIE